MARQPKRRDPEMLRRKLLKLVTDFARELGKPGLRQRVLALVPVYHTLEDLGVSVMPSESGSAARDRVLYYLRKYVGKAIAGDELLVVSGIRDWPRRVRELRVQFGWAIISGVTIRQHQNEEASETTGSGERRMKVDDYVLVSEAQDRDAAHRWNVANTIRRGSDSMPAKLLAFLRENVGRPVTGEELRYIARNASEWARRVRELRTEEGWPVLTRHSGRPDLPVGVYVLEQDRQAPAHDRTIPDDVRGEVLRRDRYECKRCKWHHAMWNRSDPRHLELHHKKPHAERGSNAADNLVTLCTICHDKIHAQERRN